jgi:hypothetical protein
MLPRPLLDGEPNPNLPFRAHTPAHRERPYRGPFDFVWTEDERGRWVRAKVRRQQSPRLKRALLRFRGPWKTRRPYHGLG